MNFFAACALRFVTFDLVLKGIKESHLNNIPEYSSWCFSWAQLQSLFCRILNPHFHLLRSLTLLSFPFCIIEVVPRRPDPPVVGKVTHHSIELCWEGAGEESEQRKGDGRLRFCLQEADKSQGWGNVHMWVWKMTLLNPWHSVGSY